MPAALLAALVLTGCGGGSGAASKASSPAVGSTPPAHGGATHRAASPGPVRLSYRPLYRLASALQDPGSAVVGSHFVLLGGLDAADTSTDAVIVGDASGAHTSATLPNAQHDAEAAAVDGRVYLFGGGQFSQYDHILAYDPASHTVSQAGTLPTAASDVAVAGTGSAAYIVGGFDGNESLNTILTWSPGAPARLAARLPVALRYAAVTAIGTSLIIAGGSTPSGDASPDIYRFDTATSRLSLLGRLPAPLTHAGAAVLGNTVYLVGGRGAGLTSQTATIWALNPSTGRLRRAGTLPQPLSDAAVFTFGRAILVAGGHSPSATQSAVGELVPAS